MSDDQHHLIANASHAGASSEVGECHLLMRFLRGLSVPQRVVVVVGLGIALLIGWIWWYVGEMQDPGGWFAYAPSPQDSLTDEYFIVRHRQPAHLAVALGLVVGWSAASILLLGLRPRDDADPATR